MPNANQPRQPEPHADQLGKLVEMLRLNISAEDLQSLADQLRLLEALERTDLGDYAPILKMDAEWHD